jgi:hypothetical protein
MLSILTYHHLSLQDRSFISLYHMHIVTMRYYHQFQSNFLQICYPHISNFTFFIFICFHTGTRFHKHEISFSSQFGSFATNSIGLPYGIILFPYPRPSFLQFHLHTTKQIVSSSCTYIFIEHLQWLQTISKWCILTIKSLLSIP